MNRLKDKLNDPFAVGQLVGYPWRGKDHTGRHVCQLRLGELIGIKPDRLILTNHKGRRVQVRNLAEVCIVRDAVEARVSSTSWELLTRTTS